MKGVLRLVVALCLALPGMAANADTYPSKIIDSPEVTARLGNAGFEAFSSTPEELGEFVKAQLVKWAKMVKDAGIQPE